MPRAYSTDLRMRVIAALQAGATRRAVAASFDIAPSTAGKWNRAFSRSGSRGARHGSAATSGPLLSSTGHGSGKRSGAPSARFSRTSNRDVARNI